MKNAEFLRAASNGFGGAAFARYLETRGRHSEANFYVSGLRDLVDEALAAGLDPAQIDRFRVLLVRGIVPEGVSVEVLVETLAL